MVVALSLALWMGLAGGCAPGPASPGNSGTLSQSSLAQNEQPSTGQSESPSPAQTGPGATIVVGGSDFGAILFDATGQAIYIFDIETTTKPLCYEACAEAWPPVLTQAGPLAGQGVKQSLLGTTPRAGGTTQVTYGGHPLYFYAHEGKREVKCHDVFLNGGNWYAVHPDGYRAP